MSYVSLMAVPFLHLMLLFFGRYVEGGMGSVSLAIGNAAKEAGACIITSAEVCVVE